MLNSSQLDNTATNTINKRKKTKKKIVIIVNIINSLYPSNCNETMSNNHNNINVIIL